MKFRMISLTAAALVSASALSAPLVGGAAALVGQADSPRTLTVKFENTTAKQVMRALMGQGVSLVYDEAILGDRTLTMHMKDAPLDEAIESLASALDLSVERRGSVFTFKPGGMRWLGRDGLPGGFRMDLDEMMGPDGPMRRFELKLDEKEIEEMMRGAGRRLQNQDEMMRAVEESMRGFMLNPDGDPRLQELKESTKEARRQVEEAMRSLRSMELFGPDVRELRSTQLNAFRETLTETQRKSATGSGLSFGDLTPQQRKLLKLSENAQGRVMVRGDRVMIMEGGPGVRTFEIGENLTPAQRERLNKGETLTAKDLSADQLKKLGIESTDDVDLKISGKDGQLSISISIKRGSA